MIEKIIEHGLIQPAELEHLLDTGAVSFKILDASFVLPGAGEDPADVFTRTHITGAQFFDIRKISDPSSALPYTLPSAAFFEKAVSDLGISNSDFIVVYGQSGMVMGPPRAWWMFKVFGHERVCVLNGNLEALKKQGFKHLSHEVSMPPKGHFKATFQPELFRSMADVENARRDNSLQILDARAAERFYGQSPEPREGLRAGHIPSSKNIPAAALIDGQTGQLKPAEVLKEHLQANGFAEDKPVIASCGSGITACALVLALHSLGHRKYSIYDGAWAEWGLESTGTEISKD